MFALLFKVTGSNDFTESIFGSSLSDFFISSFLYSEFTTILILSGSVILTDSILGSCLVTFFNCSFWGSVAFIDSFLGSSLFNGSFWDSEFKATLGLTSSIIVFFTSCFTGSFSFIVGSFTTVDSILENASVLTSLATSFFLLFSFAISTLSD